MGDVHRMFLSYGRAHAAGADKDIGLMYEKTEIAIRCLDDEQGARISAECNMGDVSRPVVAR